jgi:hypothetical protein
MKKGLKFLPYEHNALKIFFKHQNFVTIFFMYFWEKDLGVFSVSILAE